MFAEGDSSPVSILIAEDDPYIRESLELLLEDEGYVVLTSADGVAALEVALREHPDLILIDLGMPRLDGAGFCRAYREQGGPAPVILITAADPRKVEQAVTQCNAMAYIRKPFDIDQVLEAVAQHVATT
jgi:DNA-binding response OmpR family regulator